MYKGKKAFTLIEVIISVIILSGAILYVLQVHSQARDEITYVTQKNRIILQDSLFAINKIVNYHKENKNAYDIIKYRFQINKLKSRDILKNIKRDIFIPEAISIKQGEEESPLNVKFQEIKLKDKYSSYYFHFSIDSL